MAAIFFPGQEIIEIRGQQLDELKALARTTPLRRARYCLHQSHEDQVQEMLIAFDRDTYVRPHRHHGKSESFHVIEGELAVLFFDDQGRIIRRVHMGAPGSGRTFVYRLAASLWHSVLPLSDAVIIHETTNGPWVKEETEMAAWSPDDGDTAAVQAFLERMRAESDGEGAAA